MMSKKCLLFCVCAVIIIPIYKAQDPCNETQLVTAWDGIITSPGYPTYANNLSCNWLISVSPGNRIEITFHFVQLTSYADPRSRTNPCDKDFIEVRDGRNSSSPLITRLCAHTPSKPVQSRGTDIWLSFVTDAVDSYVGFILGHRGVCNVEFNSTSGVITSPNYPNNYFIYLNCLWVIELLPQAQITLAFNTFELEGVDDNGECAFDFLEIRAGTTAESPLLGKYCGNGGISTFVRHGNFTIKFKTDSDDEYMGFRLSFTTKEYSTKTFTKIETVLRKSSPYIKMTPSLTSYTDVSITPTAEYSTKTFSKIETVLRKSSPYIKMTPSLTSYTDVSITPTAEYSTKTFTEIETVLRKSSPYIKMTPSLTPSYTDVSITPTAVSVVPIKPSDKPPDTEIHYIVRYLIPFVVVLLGLFLSFIIGRLLHAPDLFSAFLSCLKKKREKGIDQTSAPNQVRWSKIQTL